MRTIRRLLFSIISRVLSLLIRPKKRMVVLGAMDGRYYGDNSRYVYEWILENRQDLTPLWITRDTKVFRELKMKKRPVCKASSVSGVVALFRAHIGLFTNSMNDIAMNAFLVPNTLRLIALRHGRSVKKVRFARETHKLSRNEAMQREEEGKHIEYVISTSEFISDVQEQCLLVGREKHIVTGYPRNDKLFSPSIENAARWGQFLGDLMPRKVVLYAPSWRHGRTATRFFPFDDFTKEQLIDTLKTNNIVLLLRPHKNDLLKYQVLKCFLADLAMSSAHIKFASHDIFPDVNAILPYVDCLISDYSALYHDFLLLDRPLFFIPYDYDDFNRQNGFLYDYFEHLPGPIIKNFREYCSCLEKICKGDDAFAQRRAVLRNKIHLYQDARSSERVVALMDTLLERK